MRRLIYKLRRSGHCRCRVTPRQRRGKISHELQCGIAVKITAYTGKDPVRSKHIHIEFHSAFYRKRLYRRRTAQPRHSERLPGINHSAPLIQRPLQWRKLFTVQLFQKILPFTPERSGTPAGFTENRLDNIIQFVLKTRRCIEIIDRTVNAAGNGGLYGVIIQIIDKPLFAELSGSGKYYIGDQTAYSAILFILKCHPSRHDYRYIDQRHPALRQQHSG